MASTWLESGSDATQDLSFWYVVTGTCASATDQSHTGWRSLKLSTGSPAVTAFLESPNDILADAGRRISFWWRTDTIPAANAFIIVMGQFDDATNVCKVQLLTTGTIQLSPVGATAVTGTTVLKTNTWYHMTLSYTITNTTTFKFVYYINGIVEATATAGTLTNVTSSGFKIRCDSAFGANANVWFDDIYVDNVADYSDPGNIVVTAKRPFSNGTANEFTTQIGVGNSGYGSGHADEVNERPLSTTNGWSISTTTRKTEEYTIEGPGAGDAVVGKIVDYGGWIYAKVDSTANSPVHRIIVNNVATAVVLTTSYALYYAFAGSTSYPSGNTDIGMDAQYTTTPHLTSLAECGILVAYIPISRLAALGAG